MQPNLVEPSQLPDLPQPGPIEHWFFEAPALPAAIVLILGVLAFYVLRHTDHAKRIGLPALGLGVILGGAIYAIGSLTVTDREMLKLRARELVAATAAGDATALNSLLDPSVRVRAVFASVDGRDKVVGLAKNRASRVVSSAQTSEINAGLFGPQVARTQIRVRVQGEMLPTLSWWAVDWTRPSADSSAWIATHIEPIWIQGFGSPAGSP